MKVKIENIKTSFYDNEKDEIHIRENLIDLRKRDELQEVLAHEIIHAMIKGTKRNLIWEYGKICLMVALTLVGIYAQFVYLPGHQLQKCIEQYNNLILGRSIQPLYCDYYNTTLNSWGTKPCSSLDRPG